MNIVIFQVFTGNVDENTAVKHDLDPPIEAWIVRLVVKTWYYGIALRWELYGCYL